MGHPKLPNVFGPWFKSKGSAKVLLEIETAIPPGQIFANGFRLDPGLICGAAD